jgi:predicted transcriptional regulator
MALENELDVFSIRLPRGLGEQVRSLAKLGRRSRNSQIVILIEQSVDLTKAKMTKGEKEKAGTLRA